MKLSDNNKQIALAVLAVLVIAVLAYALFIAPRPDLPTADASQFYTSLVNSSTVGLLLDVRGATTDAQKSAIYQCGVDMISKGRFAGKTLVNIACDSTGCISASSASNASSTLTFDQAQQEFGSVPYIYIRAGTGAPEFFTHHMEIYIPANITGNVTCDISATES